VVSVDGRDNAAVFLVFKPCDASAPHKPQANVPSPLFSKLASVHFFSIMASLGKPDLPNPLQQRHLESESENEG
jgi:hypothetical protein